MTRKLGATDRLIRAVCQEYGLDRSTLLGKSRKVDHSHPRQILMAAMQLGTPLSSTQIGHLIGGRDHSTVLHAMKAVVKRGQMPCVETVLQIAGLAGRPRPIILHGEDAGAREAELLGILATRDDEIAALKLELDMARKREVSLKANAPRGVMVQRSRRHDPYAAMRRAAEIEDLKAEVRNLKRLLRDAAAELPLYSQMRRDLVDWSQDAA